MCCAKVCFSNQSKLYCLGTLVPDGDASRSVLCIGGTPMGSLTSEVVSALFDVADVLHC